MNSSTRERPKVADAPYLRCDHHTGELDLDLILKDGPIQHRLYCSAPESVEVITERRGDKVFGVISLLKPINTDWAVCLASQKPDGGGRIRTWPEWTWGSARESVPVWFRGPNFDGRVSGRREKRSCTPKGNWLASSADVESFIGQMETDKPSRVVVTVDRVEDNGFTLLKFSYEGSNLKAAIHPKGWMFPLRAACKRLRIPVENRVPR